MLSIKLIIYLRCRAGWFIAVSLRRTWHNGFPARWVSLWMVSMDFLLNLIFQKWLTATPVLGEPKCHQIQVGMSWFFVTSWSVELGKQEGKIGNENFEVWKDRRRPWFTTLIPKLAFTDCIRQNLCMIWSSAEHSPPQQRWDEMTFGSSLHCVFISFR